ncbi:hypothetical protein Leryth_023508 [Lithospermum erythrorhizon]|nr:hypothetical protein Leryth_023508 [Lithospermum erythrorhizon]
MATSAFKSTSKRATEASAGSNSKILRRSPSTTGAVNGDEARGRSVKRNSKSGIGSSVSRVRGRSVSRTHYGAYESEKENLLISADARRRTEQKQVANSGKSSSLTRSQTDVMGESLSSQRRKRGQTGYNSEEDSACSIQILNCEDANSIGSFSEAEEKTTVHEEVKPMHDASWVSDPVVGRIYETVRSEVLRAISDIQNDLEDAIRRNNAPITTADIHPDLVNPGAIELVLDIRREYTKKLEESKERARKLRADLHIEEHRGQELIKILKEIVPEPKTSTSQRTHSRRKRSNERKNMSRCLTEEAMAYFDECVSISTFDSSDFSAPEDPPHGYLNSTKESIGSPWCSQSASKSHLAFFDKERGLVDGQICDLVETGLAINKSSNGPSVDHHVQADHDMMRGIHCVVPDAEAPAEIIRPHNDIISYAKQFKVGSDSDAINLRSRKSNYDSDSYKFQGYLDGLLFDKVLLRSRTESGGLHLCSGGFHNFTF